MKHKIIMTNETSELILFKIDTIYNPIALVHYYYPDVVIIKDILNLYVLL